MTVWPTWGYRSEPALHESLLLSKFRTLDPESADFFYVPVYTSCYLCMAGLMHPGLVPMGNLMEALEVQFSNQSRLLHVSLASAGSW